MRSKLLLLTLALLLLLPSAHAAGEDFVIEDGRLTSYQGPGGAVTVPAGVTVIGASAFEHNPSITSVTLPAGVEAIEAYAFHNCRELRRVELPAGLASVGAYAFCDCASLASVTLPYGTTSLGEGAFAWCLELERVVLPSTLTSIGDEAFFHCGILFSVTVPSTVTAIGARAFDSCPDLVLHAAPGSVAETYAQEHSLSCLADGSFLAPGVPVAYASTQQVDVDGEPVLFEMYALKGPDGSDTNYVKVRDVAYVLSGTAAQFDVSWDHAVALRSGQPYQSVGVEMSTPYAGDRTYSIPSGDTTVDGAAQTLDAILLTDWAGNGYTYYKLRDLGAALGFNVYWDSAAGRVCVRTGQSYTGQKS